MQQETILPIQATERTKIVDILRGWAILGVVLGNYGDYADIGKPFKHSPDTLSNIMGGINQFVFAAKSWTLLSVLFGYGFAIVMRNVAAKGKSPVKFFIIRMFWLFVIAFVNSAFWFGDILKDYAFLGLVLLFFYKASVKVTFRTGLFLLLIVPFVTAGVAHLFPPNPKLGEDLIPMLYTHNWLMLFETHLKATYFFEVINPQYAISVHIMMLACMLFGFAAQQIDFFNRLPEFKKQITTAIWIGLTIAIIINAANIYANVHKLGILNFIRPRYWAVFATMIMIASGICCLYIGGKLKRFFDGLQAMGKMTLTNYMAQNILAWFIFLNPGLGIFNTKPYWLYFLIAIVVFAIQIPLSKLWLNYYNYGPVEWVWRQLSYGKRFPIKKQLSES
jgi:uncharacterized protein